MPSGHQSAISVSGVDLARLIQEEQDPERDQDDARDHRPELVPRPPRRVRLWLRRSHLKSLNFQSRPRLRHWLAEPGCRASTADNSTGRKAYRLSTNSTQSDRIGSPGPET